MAGGGASKKVIDEEGDKPLVPGSPLSIAMVTGDFDLSGIGTVTHVEGNRVYGFGHPMFSLGTCDFPLMTGYIHTVYPRASVSMKMGSPLKTVGILDTDVSTGVAGNHLVKTLFGFPVFLGVVELQCLGSFLLDPFGGMGGKEVISCKASACPRRNDHRAQHQ